MKFLCDVHIPLKLVRYFISKNIEAIHINNILDKWFTTDEKISSFADKKKYVLITKDTDFKKSFLLNQKPKQLILVALGNISTSRLIEIFETNLKDILNLKSNSVFMLEIHQDYVELF